MTLIRRGFGRANILKYKLTMPDGDSRAARVEWVEHEGDTVELCILVDNEPPLWKTMDTAPKDGSEILLASFGGDIGLCYWRDDAVMRGWTWGLGKAFNGATHWMPKPEAPLQSNKFRTGDF